MAKRGDSGLSFIMGVNKPAGISSHDVINRCRTVFKEKRIGHAGTLDPLASGVLMVCVGPATRLNDYFVHDDKSYRFRVQFGTSTTTDDAEGEVIESKAIPKALTDRVYAQTFVENLVGRHDQVPPSYSAIKVDGKRAYKEARKGNAVSLKSRSIEVYSASLRGISEAGEDLYWDVEVKVSKGTYIRSLARDIGLALDCPAHVSKLERIQSGLLPLEKCFDLEDLGNDYQKYTLDPVKELELPCLSIFEDKIQEIKNGVTFAVDSEAMKTHAAKPLASISDNQLQDVCFGECDHQNTVALATDTRLEALYEYDKTKGIMKPRCVFSVGVYRGNNT